MIRKGVGLRIIMKQFNLEEYLANPNKKIITRSGNEARIVCTDKLGKYPIVALIKGGSIETMVDFESDGKYRHDFGDNDSDLFFATEKKEGWINIYKSKSMGAPIGGTIYDSEEEAETEGKRGKNYIETIKIEWEEE